jgi:hypothetical protein
VQRGIWVPTQHLLWDQGKPWKTLIELAGRRTFRMQLTSTLFTYASADMVVTLTLQIAAGNLVSVHCIKRVPINCLWIQCLLRLTSDWCYATTYNKNS